MMLGLLGSAILGGGVAVGGYKLLEPTNTNAPQVVAADPNVRYTSELRNSDYVVPEGLNFVAAASSVTPAVVHVMTEYAPKMRNSAGAERMDPLLRQFFGEEFEQYHGGGSGRATRLR